MTQQARVTMLYLRSLPLLPLPYVPTFEQSCVGIASVFEWAIHKIVCSYSIEIVDAAMRANMEEITGEA